MATKKAFREFEKQLLARRDALRAAVQAGLHSMGQQGLAREVGDLEDSALATWMEELQILDLRHDVEELNDIDQALQRIEKGRYGECADCGESIPERRLKAYPTAKRCLGCQEEYESQRRRTG